MRTIAELEEAAFTSYNQCNYSLGERLFFDLYEELGEEEFRQGFLALYLNSIDENGRGISHVTQAFGDKASNVIARWYDGSEPYNLTRFDDRPVDPDLPAFNGRIQEVSIVIGDDDSPVTEFYADVGEWMRLRLKYSHDVPRERTIEIKMLRYFEDGLAYGFPDPYRKLTAKPGRNSSSEKYGINGPGAGLGKGRIYHLCIRGRPENSRNKF